MSVQMELCNNSKKTDFNIYSSNYQVDFKYALECSQPRCIPLFTPSVTQQIKKKPSDNCCNKNDKNKLSSSQTNERQPQSDSIKPFLLWQTFITHLISHMSNYGVQDSLIKLLNELIYQYNLILPAIKTYPTQQQLLSLTTVVFFSIPYDVFMQIITQTYDRSYYPYVTPFQHVHSISIKKIFIEKTFSHRFSYNYLCELIFLLQTSMLPGFGYLPSKSIVPRDDLQQILSHGNKFPETKRVQQIPQQTLVSPFQSQSNSLYLRQKLPRVLHAITQQMSFMDTKTIQSYSLSLLPFLQHLLQASHAPFLSLNLDKSRTRSIFFTPKVSEVNSLNR